MNIRVETWLGHEINPVNLAKTSGYIPILEYLSNGECIKETFATGNTGEYLALTNNGELLYVSHWYGDSDNILVPNVARTVKSILNGETELADAFASALKILLDNHYDKLIAGLPEGICGGVAGLIGYSKKEKTLPISKLKIKAIEYVYFLTADNGLTKIGRTSSLSSRMHHFTTKLPYKLTESLILETEDSPKLEAELHSHFANKRVRGEWFTLNDEDILLASSLGKRVVPQ